MKIDAHFFFMFLKYFLVLRKLVKNPTPDDTMSCPVSCKASAGRTWKALEAVEAFLVSYRELDDLSGSSSSGRC